MMGHFAITLLIKTSPYTPYDKKVPDFTPSSAANPIESQNDFGNN
jgi:hypothetical protein